MEGVAVEGKQGSGRGCLLAVLCLWRNKHSGFFLSHEMAGCFWKAFERCGVVAMRYCTGGVVVVVWIPLVSPSVQVCVGLWND